MFFSPEDVDLVKGGAGGRRRFLDMELSQVDGAYLAALQQYRQVLRQRNELLRQPKADVSLIEVWDAQLVRYGGEMIAARRAFLEELAPLAAAAHAGIARGEGLGLAYAPDVEGGEALEKALERSRDSDIRRGVTSRGPHRDDMEMRIGGHPARSHGSQGQQRTAALALKLAELELVHRRAGEYPVLMLDEVLAELDAARAKELFHAVGPEVQCLVTTTDRSEALDFPERDRRIFEIQGGRLGRA